MRDWFRRRYIDLLIRAALPAIEKDEPSQWPPYDNWLKAHGRRDPRWWERWIDSLIHSELMIPKLPVLFINPWLRRRTDWADASEPAERLAWPMFAAA